MTEQNQEYQTERKETPNLRNVKCCENCMWSEYFSPMECSMSCLRHMMTVKYTQVCDDYAPDN